MTIPESRTTVVYGAVACACSLAILAVLSWLRLLAPLDDLAYDALLRNRAAAYLPAVARPGPAKPDPSVSSDILLVAIDEESMTELDQRWPWPRSLYARLIENLNAAGVKAIGIDLLFLEDSEKPAEDEALAGALRSAGNVVLAAKLEESRRRFGSPGDGENDETEATVRRLQLPVPKFRDAARNGLVNLELDTGTMVRSCRFFYAHQQRKYPTFARVIAETAYPQRPPPLPPDERPLIDYLGPPGSFPVVPAYQVIREKDPAGSKLLARFKDKIALVGVTFTDAHDMYATPFTRRNELCPGVEVQANILAGLLRNAYCTRTPHWHQLVVLAALVLLSGYLGMFRSAWALAAVFAVALVTIVAGEVLMMRHWGMFMDISYPLLAMPLTFALVSLPMRKPLVLETKVGPYRLLEELGHGGMAIVYRARHPRTGEIVALKQMLPEYRSDERSVQRFLREIDLIRQLNHPNIVHIVDAGEVNGLPYFAMEYLNGPTLEKVLEEQARLSPAEVRRIGGAVARALAKAHQVGVIHRDIKPGNIMLSVTGTPKLTDFGIARRADAPKVTQTGKFMGTPLYIAPEACSGESATPAADIYSLGATLYSLLTGRPPFVHEDNQVLFAMILSKPPPDLRLLRHGVPEDLAEIIMQCIAKRPEDRPPDMLAVARRLDPYETEVAESAESESAGGAAAHRAPMGPSGTLPLSTGQTTPALGATDRTQQMSAKPPA